jgi:hypothetical protein
MSKVQIFLRNPLCSHSTGGILAMPQFLEYFNYPSNFQQGGITSAILAGAFVGSLLTGAFLRTGLVESGPFSSVRPYLPLVAQSLPLPMASLL